jgi:hypothetical protein
VQQVAAYSITTGGGRWLFPSSVAATNAINASSDFHGG